MNINPDVLNPKIAATRLLLCHQFMCIFWIYWLWLNIKDNFVRWPIFKWLRSCSSFSFIVSKNNLSVSPLPYFKGKCILYLYLWFSLTGVTSRKTKYVYRKYIYFTISANYLLLISQHLIWIFQYLTLNEQLLLKYITIS